MKLCLITPAVHVRMTSYLPGRFCLANVALHDEVYRRYFTPCATPTAPVILDNGVFENELIDDKALYELAKEIRPDVLICPDVINSPGEENWERAVAFMHRAPKSQADFMYVPQTVYGDDVSFWKQIDRVMTSPIHPRWLGLCRDACKNAFMQFTGTADQELNRFYFLSEFKKRGYDLAAKQHNKKIHLLGIGNNLFMYQYFGIAASADTASFFWQAAEYGRVLGKDGRFHDELTMKRPLGYMSKNYHLGAATNDWMQRVKINCSVAQSFATKAELKKQTIQDRI